MVDLSFYRIKDTLNVPSDHTYGILYKPDEYGAGDLLHNRVPGKYLRGRDQQRGLIAAMRAQLKKLNYHSFPDLVRAFQWYDKVRIVISYVMIYTVKPVSQKPLGLEKGGLYLQVVFIFPGTFNI